MNGPLFRKDRAEPFPIKYSCTRPHALQGLYGLSDLQGQYRVVKRCACLRGEHVTETSDPRNGADALALRADDYVDPADAPRRDEAPRRDAAPSRTAAQARADMVARASSAWRTPRRDTLKFQCLDNGDGRFVVVDLNGKRSLIRRCCCAGSHHVVDVQHPDNAADVCELRAVDYLDRRELAPPAPGRVDSAPAPQPGLFTRHLRTRPGAPVRTAAQAREEMLARAQAAGREPIPEVVKTMGSKRVDWP